MLTVGIIPSPGIAHQHVKKIIPMLNSYCQSGLNIVNGISTSKSIS